MGSMTATGPAMTLQVGGRDMVMEPHRARSGESAGPGRIPQRCPFRVLTGRFSGRAGHPHSDGLAGHRCSGPMDHLRPGKGNGPNRGCPVCPAYIPGVWPVRGPATDLRALAHGAVVCQGAVTVEGWLRVTFSRFPTSRRTRYRGQRQMSGAWSPERDRCHSV